MTDFCVLLIEDVAQDQATVMLYLNQIGALVHTADNAMSAIVEINTNVYDLVLASLDTQDNILPSVIMCMRADPRLASIPVIGMSAAIPASTARARLGLRALLDKPLDERNFTTLVHACRDEKMSVVQDIASTGSLIAAGAIDAAAALKRLKGNAGLYLKVLTWFEQEAQTMSTKLKLALEAGEKGDATRMVHDFKTLAATTGANELHQCLSALEVVMALQNAGEMEIAFSNLQTITLATLDHVARHIASLGK